jgi:wyosine [tRNA(Phe)-imidazoG37] synthetase (radical SAM superfamily)
VSRRAGGVSIGINLSPNNACNFRCVYCQVPNLIFGKSPEIALEVLERELDDMLQNVLHGSFMEQHVPEGSRRLNDIALSGNGEPTSSPDFPAAIEVIGRALHKFGLTFAIDLVLITNGTLTDKANVARALHRMSELGGHVWFKFDSATQEGAKSINSSAASVAERLERLDRCARVCPTWIQTCMFMRHGQAPSDAECAAYLAAVAALVERGTPLEGILLYGLARPSLQPEAPTLSALSAEWLEAFAERARALGVTVRVSP